MPLGPNFKQPTQRVAFTRQSAERIAKVVRLAESGTGEANGLAFQRPVHPPQPVFRVATFGTAAWSKSSSATITFVTTTATPNTATAVNLFADIATATASRSCAVARDGTAWYLIAAECD